MHLTREEERIYDGECGWANQTCIRILVRLGELFGAEKLILIDSAHVSGVSYKTLGDAPIEFLRALADAGARVKVRTTLNPQSLDSHYLGKKLQKDLQEPQLDILRQFERMGLTQSLTCTPYYLQRPKRGLHHAWAESSAVVYANSVLGAWTNREGGPSALAAAIIGKTPDYGIHRTENRRPNVTVKVETKLRNETELGALGIFLGKTLGDKIPAIKGLPNTSRDRLKQLCAAIATTGMTNMFHLDSTPRTGETEKIGVDSHQIKQTIEELSTASASQPDLVFLGCPHCSLNEMKRIARLVEGKRVRAGTEFWVCTSCHIRQMARDHVKKIEKAGGHVLDGVCTVVSWTERLGIKTIMTNSAKTAYYAPTLNKAEPLLAPLQDCLKSALIG
ncbi:MAG: aconitase X catalytic domain-containing protein [Candidatus Bathyarchaeia archaeon]